MVAVLRDCFINLQLEKHLPSSMFLGHRAKTTRPSVQVRIHVVYCDCVYIWVCIVWVCANKYLLNSVNLGHYTCRMKRGSTYRLLNCLCFKQFNLCLAYTSCVTKIICNLLHCHSCTYSSALLQEWTHLKQCIHGMICALYERDCRRPFCPPDHWAVLPSMQHIPPELFLENEGMGNYSALFSRCLILTNL